MLRTLLELPGPDGRLRLAKLAGDEHDATLFVGLSLGQVAQVQRLNRGQVLELVDVLDEWLFDTSTEGRRPRPTMGAVDAIAAALDEAIRYGDIAEHGLHGGRRPTVQPLNSRPAL